MKYDKNVFFNYTTILPQIPTNKIQCMRDLGSSSNALLLWIVQTNHREWSGLKENKYAAMYM